MSCTIVLCAGVMYICCTQTSFVMHLCPVYNCDERTVCINTIDLKTSLSCCWYRIQDAKETNICTVSNHHESRLRQQPRAPTDHLIPTCLQEEDVILCENSIDFAMKSKNPLDNVHFFDNFDSRDKYSMLKNTVSPMYPDIFQASPA